MPCTGYPPRNFLHLPSCKYNASGIPFVQRDEISSFRLEIVNHQFKPIDQHSHTPGQVSQNAQAAISGQLKRARWGSRHTAVSTLRSTWSQLLEMFRQ
jgi:hypothetical protein